MTAAVVALGGLTIIIALIVIAWAVRALFFRDLGQRARPRHEPPDDPPWLPAPPHTSPGAYSPAGPSWREQEPGAAAAGVFPLDTPPPPPELSHDAFRWPQWYHDEPAVARREATLAPLGAVSAVLVVAAITAEAWHAEVLAPFPRNEPFANCLSEDTIARAGVLPAIRDHGDWDAPLSIPPEVIHEMEAGV